MDQNGNKAAQDLETEGFYRQLSKLNWQRSFLIFEVRIFVNSFPDVVFNYTGECVFLRADKNDVKGIYYGPKKAGEWFGV